MLAFILHNAQTTHINDYRMFYQAYYIILSFSNIVSRILFCNSQMEIKKVFLWGLSAYFDISSHTRVTQDIALLELSFQIKLNIVFLC